jgi:hypothetical protein
MGVRHPRLAGLLLVEPPLRTENLWPLAEQLSQDPEFLRAVFGIVDHQIAEPRDYTPLLAGVTAPMEVLLGDSPLMPRRLFERCPSLVDDPSRDALARAGVTVTIAKDAGHHVAAQAGLTFVAALNRLLARIPEPV